MINTCVVCGKSLPMITRKDRVYCSRSCVERASKMRAYAKRDAERAALADANTLPCKVCGTRVPQVLGQRARLLCGHRCSLLSREQATRAQLSKAIARTIPCATCQHGVSSIASDTGWECRLERVMSCRPFADKTLYTSRDV